MTATSLDPDPVSSGILRQSGASVSPAFLSEIVEDFWIKYQEIWCEEKGKQWLSSVSDFPLPFAQKLNWSSEGFRALSSLSARLVLKDMQVSGAKRPFLIRHALREWGLALRKQSGVDDLAISRRWYGSFLNSFQDDPEVLKRWAGLVGGAGTYGHQSDRRLVAIAWDHATPIPLRYFSRSAILGVLNEWRRRTRRPPIHSSTLKLDLLGSRMGLNLTPHRPWFIAAWEKDRVHYRPDARKEHSALPYIFGTDLERIYKRPSLPK